MSIKVMSAVWDFGPDDATMKLVLLALADIADDAGKCWPSMERIAQRGCMSDRNARRIIRKLEDAGWLRIQTHPGRNKTNTYWVTKPDTALSALTDCPPGHPEHENRTPKVSKPDTALSAKPSRTINEPSLGAKAKTKRKPEVPLPDNWVPSDRNIADAEARQFSAQEIRHEADQFRNYHTSKGSVYRDWDAAWRTWLGNARKYRPVAGSTKPFGNGQGASMASIVAQRRIAGGV